MKPHFFIVFSLFIGQFLNRGEQRKIISDEDYNYVFHVTVEPLKFYKNSKKYYWYKSGEIHASVGGSNGDLLQGLYTKSLRDNSMLEQGLFKKGLKDKVWKEWYPSGSLKTTTEWKEGLRAGWALTYSEEGTVISGGKYKNNKKHGIWINGQNTDTLYFKDGALIDQRNKRSFKQKVGLFLKDLFAKKEKDNPGKKKAADREGKKRKRSKEKTKKKKTSKKQKDKS